MTILKLSGSGTSARKNGRTLDITILSTRRVRSFQDDQSKRQELTVSARIPIQLESVCQDAKTSGRHNFVLSIFS